MELVWNKKHTKIVEYHRIRHVKHRNGRVVGCVQGGMKDFSSGVIIMKDLFL